MKKILLSAICFLSINYSVAAEASADSIKALINKTGGGDMAVQIMKQMLPSLKQMVPDAPNEFWEGVMNKADADGFVNLIVPIYQRHFSQEDIDNLSAFYDTEIGKKFIRVQPALVAESMQAGQQWGEKIARDVLAEYEKRYKK